MVAVYQQDIVWGDPQANRERLERAFASAPEAELYVFPEMFTTGFATLPEAKVETSADETLAWMKRMA
ncbi:MAG: nitrilase family protein, partial [Bacteroidales bacterium]|nr:nitrilase family protein [Bacteroidales bacterium]